MNKATSDAKDFPTFFFSPITILSFFSHTIYHRIASSLISMHKLCSLPPSSPRKSSFFSFIPPTPLPALHTVASVSPFAPTNKIPLVAAIGWAWQPCQASAFAEICRLLFFYFFLQGCVWTGRAEGKLDQGMMRARVGEESSRNDSVSRVNACLRSNKHRMQASAVGERSLSSPQGNMARIRRWSCSSLTAPFTGLKVELVKGKIKWEAGGDVIKTILVNKKIRDIDTKLLLGLNRDRDQKKNVGLRHCYSNALQNKSFTRWESLHRLWFCCWCWCFAVLAPAPLKNLLPE